MVDKPKNKENEPPRQLKVIKTVPLDAKGRKRQQSVSALDDFADVNIQPKSFRLSNIGDSSKTSGNAMLIDLSETRNSPRPVPNLLSANFQNIMNDLDGLDFSMRIEKNRPVPGLLPIKSNIHSKQNIPTATIAKGDVVKMILNRTDPKANTSGEFEALHYSDSD